MRTGSIFIFSLVLLAACGDEPDDPLPRQDASGVPTEPIRREPPTPDTSGATAPKAERDTLELPTVKALGALPPEEGRVTVRVEADGSLAVNGTACSWEELPRRLIAHTSQPLPRSRTSSPRGSETSRSPGAVLPEALSLEAQLAAERAPAPRDREVEGLDGTRNADVLLRIDRRVPWAVVSHVIGVGAQRGCGLWRMFHAAQGQDGKGEGAIALFVSKANPEDAIELSNFVVVGLMSKEGTGPVPVRPVADEVRRRMRNKHTVVVASVLCAPLTPYEDAMRMIDAALRAGATGIVLFDPSVPPGTPPDWCAAAKDAGPFHLSVRGKATAGGVKSPALGVSRAEDYYGAVNALELVPPLTSVDDLEPEDSGK